MHAAEIPFHDLHTRSGWLVSIHHYHHLEKKPRKLLFHLHLTIVVISQPASQQRVTLHRPEYCRVLQEATSASSIHKTTSKWESLFVHIEPTTTWPYNSNWLAGSVKIERSDLFIKNFLIHRISPRSSRRPDNNKLQHWPFSRNSMIIDHLAPGCQVLVLSLLTPSPGQRVLTGALFFLLSLALCECPEMT